MTRKKRSLTEEEKKLWDHVARQVIPLKKDKKKQAIKPPISRPLTQPRHQADVPLGTSFSNNPLPPTRKIQRVRKVKIEAHLDLHGLTREQAYHRLMHFLKACQSRKYSWVIIITGKGRQGREKEGGSSLNRGVLRELVPQWLEGSVFQPFVSGYAPAKPHHGGEGALYVRLKREKLSG